MSVKFDNYPLSVLKPLTLKVYMKLTLKGNNVEKKFGVWGINPNFLILMIG